MGRDGQQSRSVLFYAKDDQIRVHQVLRQGEDPDGENERAEHLTAKLEKLDVPGKKKSNLLR